LGVGTPEGEIAFPLSPTVAFMGSNQGTPGAITLVEIKQKIVREVNRRMAAGAAHLRSRTAALADRGNEEIPPLPESNRVEYLRGRLSRQMWYTTVRPWRSTRRRPVGYQGTCRHESLTYSPQLHLGWPKEKFRP
jgi:hypothetical protein